MARQCNIDSRGRVIRAWLGVVLLLLGVGLAFIGGHYFGSSLAWGAAAVASFAGVFALVEARLGWCAARAAGLRVPF
jgi:hypothetical protein